MAIKPIPIPQNKAGWFVLNQKNFRRIPERYTDVNLCVTTLSGDFYFITQGYLGDDNSWFTANDDSNIPGVVLAWAPLDCDRQALALIASREWKVWM